MSSPTLFSREYYTNDSLFNENMEILAANSTSLTKGLFTWNFRRTHAHIDSQGTVSVIPFSFFNKLQRCFSWRHDSNLVAVHSRLKDLEAKLNDPESNELIELKREMSQFGKFGRDSLRSNLEQLSACFEKANAKNSLTLTMMKVVNFFRRLLQLKPLELVPPPLNIDLFVPNFYSNAPPPDNLTTESFQKLKEGHLNQLNFAVGGKSCTIEYDRKEQAFTLSYFPSNEELPRLDDLFKYKENDISSLGPLKVVEIETKKDGSRSEQKHLLYYWSDYICYKFPGFLSRFLPPIREWYFAHSDKLVLKEGCIYACEDLRSKDQSFYFKLEKQEEKTS